MLYTFYILYAYKLYYYIVYYYYIMQNEDLTFSTKISAHNLIYLHIFLCTYKNFHVETDHFWVIFGNSKLIHLIGLNCFIRWIKFANSYWLFLRFCTCKFLDKEGPWNLSSGNFNGQIRMLKSLWCCLMSCHKQSIGYTVCHAYSIYCSLLPVKQHSEPTTQAHCVVSLAGVSNILNMHDIQSGP